jgi:hypothetical protein
MEKPVHVVESCAITEVEEALDRLSGEYDLIAMSPYQIGTGFGARNEVLLAFRLKEKEESDGRLRRKPIAPLIPQKKPLDTAPRASMRN